MRKGKAGGGVAARPACAVEVGLVVEGVRRQWRAAAATSANVDQIKADRAGRLAGHRQTAEAGVVRVHVAKVEQVRVDRGLGARLVIHRERDAGVHGGRHNEGDVACVVLRIVEVESRIGQVVVNFGHLNTEQISHVVACLGQTLAGRQRGLYQRGQRVDLRVVRYGRTHHKPLFHQGLRRRTRIARCQGYHRNQTAGIDIGRGDLCAVVHHGVAAIQCGGGGPGLTSVAGVAGVQVHTHRGPRHRGIDHHQATERHLVGVGRVEWRQGRAAHRRRGRVRDGNFVVGAAAASGQGERHDGAAQRK